MTPTQATALLGLLPDETKSAQSIRSAFARKVKEAHPDTSRLTAAQAFSMQDLKSARDVLLAELATQNNACALCCGTGMVRGKIGQRACGACEGTGERK